MKNLMYLKVLGLPRMAMLLIVFNAFIAIKVRAQIADKGSESQLLEITFHKTTSIIFPTAIKNVDRGSRDIMAQKAKGVENILQLKAGRTDFPETNLTVITADGKLHHFIVHYAPEPDKLVIHAGQGKSSPTECLPVIFTSQVDNEVLSGYANNILSMKRTTRLAGNRDNKINLSLQGIFIHGNTIFYHMKIKNRSNIDYEIDFLKFYIRDNKQPKRTATQEVEIDPLFVQWEAEKMVKGQSEIDLVYALEKFTIPDAKHLVIELFEQHGGRHLELRIKNSKIVRAKPVPTN